MMIAKRFTKSKLKNAIFGCLFAIVGIFGGVAGIVTQPAYAVPEEEAAVVEGDGANETTETAETETSESGTSTSSQGGISCKKSLLHIGWIVCSLVEDVSKAVDFLYDQIEPILVINPIKMGEDEPIYRVWNYVKGFANIVFTIFLLVMVYSQITGYGITNYGIKKALPKLIVAAVLVNLSFVICSLAVEVSNILGNGLRGMLAGIQYETLVVEGGNIGLYDILTGATVAGAGIAAVVAFEAGAIWMLIPTILGGLVSVVVGFITIAMRQAVIVLLIMVAPMAIAANMFPNTEQWFKKWKDLLMRMLVFYPMFSLLFGASSLAGWALIASALAAQNGTMLIIGMAVRLMPLFFAGSLMKMSGTFLSSVNSKLSSLAARPLAANRSWAESHRELSRARYLEHGRTPSAHLMGFLSNRRIVRETETSKLNASIKARGAAKYALGNYTSKGNISRRGQRMYEAQARGARYEAIVRMDEDNFNEGLQDLNNNANYRKTIAGIKRDMLLGRGAYSTRIKGRTLNERLGHLDMKNVEAFDDLKVEIERGAKIEYENAKGYHERMAKAINAHLDQEAEAQGDNTRKLHYNKNNSESVAEHNAALGHYERIKDIMEGKEVGIHWAAAGAASSFSAQAQVAQKKFGHYFDYTYATQDIVHKLNEMTRSGEFGKSIDPIISGLRVLNMRGDTDLVKNQIRNMLTNEESKIELGTYVSQSLANFLMFDVKGNDPTLRRFGKYINLETARMWNDNEPGKRRTRKDITYDEYINGEYDDYDEDGNPIYEADGRTPKKAHPKRDAGVLLLGTSYKDIERTAIASMTEWIRESSVDENGKFDFEKFKRNEDKIWKAIMPNIISDQFSYLSGSEQIMALGKGVTGVDVNKRVFDWKGIFGKYVDDLTDEQKNEYLEFVSERTKTFQAGQVPSQISKTKSDMLDAIKTQLSLKHAAAADPELAKKLNDPNFKWLSNSDDPKAVKSEFEEKTFKKYQAGVKEEFKNMYAKNALKGFVKQFQKGYQGEAKEGLVEMLDPETLYMQFIAEEKKNKKQERRDNEEEEGRPVDGNSEAEQGGAGDGNPEISRDIDSIFASYNNGAGRHDVRGFWEEVKGVLAAHPEVDGMSALISDIESGLSGYTHVAELWEVLNNIFG